MNRERENNNGQCARMDSFFLPRPKWHNLPFFLCLSVSLVFKCSAEHLWREMSFPVSISSLLNDGERWWQIEKIQLEMDGRKRGARARERVKMSRKLVPPLRSMKRCDRFITERKWRNKTPLCLARERPMKWIYSNNREVASLLSLSICSPLACTSPSFLSLFLSSIYLSIEKYYVNDHLDRTEMNLLSLSD